MQFFKTHWNKILILCFSIAIIFFAFSYILDIKGKELVDKSFNQSVIVFGSAKALNAVISLAQGTELDLPFFTVAIGEVLDPINDLIEQFSLVMLASMVSLGIQKIMMNFVTADIYNYILLFSVIILNFWMFYRFTKDDRFRTLFFKITVILIFLRFAVPLIGLANDFVYNNFVKQEYNIQELNQDIVKVKEDVNEVTKNTIENKEDSSFFTKITEKFDSSYYDKKIEEYKKAVDKSSDYIVALIIAFVFQTILLPIIFLFILYHFVRGIFNLGK
ncbi:hypothetical protein [Arcobacter sp.]|uniref:hypothetical protein n=1 Tax=unclassified Arcobacter TaxID=2593671 RepID=UPI003AFF83AA|eukprot:TRINITY_DN22609_c0_g1_i2.p1 TRINITY_DN22609_c0_g1~~TRINITY_DN22609_c0_g1_i2.p1  ORF type:complete len:275 (+),score=-45.19 TRINITY_DN22609_c0_g1_i2:39-863(+)